MSKEIPEVFSKPFGDQVGAKLAVQTARTLYDLLRNAQELKHVASATKNRPAIEALFEVNRVAGKLALAFGILSDYEYKEHTNLCTQDETEFFTLADLDGDDDHGNA